MELKIFKRVNSYAILAGILILFEVLYILRGNWYGDFFEHSAVVNELSKNLFHPNNPIIKSDIPHAFFSPYSFLVACFSKITGLNSINSLAWFAFFNLIFFISSFYYFSKCIFKKKYITIATFSLIFTLFFWGKSPFIWSGFYHIFGLHFVLPYPSTFAMALSLLILGLVSKNNRKYNLIIILCNTVVFITHPITGGILFVGIITLTFSLNNYSIKRCIIKSVVFIVPCIILSLFWPYFNIINLFIRTDIASVFHQHSSFLYTEIFKTNWPLLFVIPSIVFSKKDSVVVFLSLTAALLLLVYVAGFLFSFYGVVRVISGAMFFSHFLIVYTAVFLAEKLKLFNKVYLVLLFLAFIISISLNASQIRNITVRLFNVNDTEYYNKFSFLNSLIKPNEVILSDMKSNWYIPSYKGKVIAHHHPLYWVKDYEDRKQSVYSFFNKENKDSLRLITIENYQPDYILINYENVDFRNSTLQWLKSIGKTIYNKNNLELIKINKKKQ